MDPDKIRDLLQQKKDRMRACLDACAACSLCAESCFLFREKDRDPQYMPSYKVIHSLGQLYRKQGRVSWAELVRMQQLLWRNCVLCGRCYCPFGIDLPNMIAYARGILRSQGIYGVFPHTSGAPEAEYGVTRDDTPRDTRGDAAPSRLPMDAGVTAERPEGGPTPVSHTTPK